MAGVSVAKISVQKEPSAVWSHSHQLLLDRHSGSLFQKVRGRYPAVLHNKKHQALFCLPIATKIGFYFLVACS